MTKQEEIRERLAELEYEVTDWYLIMPWDKAPDFAKGICYGRADCKISYLHSQDVVIKVKKVLPAFILEIKKHLEYFDIPAGSSFDRIKKGYSFDFGWRKLKRDFPQDVQFIENEIEPRLDFLMDSCTNKKYFEGVIAKADWEEIEMIASHITTEPLIKE